MSARIVDHYELHEELGRGGMATVYRATDLRLHREVALKLLHTHIADQADSRARFIREARAGARLRHPNILHIYDFSGEAERVGYLATELIDGPTLREMNARDLRAFPELAACLLLILARALDHAHSAGVIHRDIKPENIMIDKMGRPRLMDFGLARVRDTQRMTVTGTLMGSPAHMAPEIVEGGDYDGRVDIFALGTVLYFLCTGHLPFEAENPASLLRKILEGEYTPAIEHNERILSPLNDIIDCMLARDPDDRYSDAKTLADALEAFLHDVNVDSPQHVFQEWWTQRATFFDTWTPSLVEAIAQQALRAAEQGSVAIPEALDWTNRLLTLDPQSRVGHDLLIRISTQSSHAAMRRRLALALLMIAAVALPMLLVRHFISPPAAEEHRGRNFVHEELHTQIQRAQDYLQYAESQLLARHVFTQAVELNDPPHVIAQNRAQSEALAQLERNVEEARKASLRAAEAKQLARRQRTAPTPADAPKSEPADSPRGADVFRVQVMVQPPAAQVFIDGQRHCENSSRCTLSLPKGTYEFAARHPVTEMEIRRRVPIEQDGVTIRMRVPWKPATLIVESDRPGIVLLDGQRVGQTDDRIQVQIEGLQSTKRGQLRVIPDGDFGVPIERTVDLSSGETRRERVRF